MRRRGLLLAMGLLTGVQAAPAQPPRLRCEFAWTQGHRALRFRLRNLGREPLWLLRWGTPFEGLWAAPFVHLKADGLALPYQGAQIKRGEPEAADYFRLAAGASKTVSVELSPAYAIPPGASLEAEAGWRWIDVIEQGRPPRPRALHQGLDQVCDGPI